MLVARTCGSSEGSISKDEAIELVREQAAFEPCAQPRCVTVANVPRGLPPRRYWLVGLARRLNADGNPVQVQSFLVDAESGAVARP